MAEDFIVEIPFDMGESKGSSSGNKEIKELNKGIKNLDKTMYMNLDIVEMLSSLLGDVYKIVQPLFKMLSLLLLIFFMPFMPIIEMLIEKLSEFAKWLLDSDGIKQITAFVQIIADVISWIITAIKEIVTAILGGLAIVITGFILLGKLIWEGMKLIWETTKKAFTAFWEILKESWEQLKQNFIKLWEGIKWVWTDLIKPVFEWLASGIAWVWTDVIKPAFEFLKDVGQWVWDKILQPAFNWLADVGTKIWDILKKPFDWLADKIKSINIFKENEDTSVNDAIIKPNGDIIRTHPKDYIFATKTPEKMMGGGQGNVTVNINNPSVRNDSDIKKIAEEVSKVMERRLWRSY
jgi:phage-related protein